MAQKPDRVVAILGARGCVVRNPAFAVLQSFGLLDPERGYRAWLDTVARPSSDGWIVPDPDHPATPAGRFRRVLADYALADLDAQGRSARLDALMTDLRHGCQAVGVPVPDEPALAHDRLLELLNALWDRVPIPNGAPIPVLDRSGDSANGLAAVQFSNGWTAVDLDDLGGHGGRYQPAAPAAIQAALSGTSRRAGTQNLGRAGTVR